jgi:hypothetical protein
MQIGSMAYRICVVRPMSNYISSCMVCGVSMRLPDTKCSSSSACSCSGDFSRSPGRLTRRMSVSQVRFG